MEILSTAQMYAADRYAAAHGAPTPVLMENAGARVAEEIARRWSARPVSVLCGPGNNGGDGFVIARLLAEKGWPVTLALLGARAALGGDAAIMADKWTGPIAPLTPAALDGAELAVDALFGAGLTRPLEGAARETVLALSAKRILVVAVDVPSGLHGDSGKVLGDACARADLTVTFFRKKPAHVLMPGRMLCGAVAVARIGIPDAALNEIKPTLRENGPEAWGAFPRLDPMGHKYDRGHALIVSGPAHATGAARLAARGALRAGAGLVSVASPLDAVAVNANHLTAIMVKPFQGHRGLRTLLADKRYTACAIGPGLGLDKPGRALVEAALETPCVLDADALSLYRDDPARLFDKLGPESVLTPHEGEFERLFPGLLRQSPSRVEAVRAAAQIAVCTVLLKGPDTVIADPLGIVTVCTNAPPYLATAGSGDVLTGIVAGLLAQGVSACDAACAGAWLHAEAANLFGAGLIAEDLPEQLPAVLRKLEGMA